MYIVNHLKGSYTSSVNGLINKSNGLNIINHKPTHLIEV